MWILLPACLMNKTFEEWVALYNRKVSSPFERDERFTLFYLPEKGFAEIADSGKIIIVNQACGELKYWRKLAENIAEQRGRSHLGTVCLRPILPYMRLAGLKIARTETTKFGTRYYFKDKQTGQKGRASPTNEGSYFVTWEVTANEI